MRNIFVVLGALAALLGAVAINDTATAGHAAKAYVCWTAIGGFTDCDWLPAGYRIPGVKRPTCCDVRGDSDRSAFVLDAPADPRAGGAGRPRRHHGAGRVGRGPSGVQEAPQTLNEEPALALRQRGLPAHCGEAVVLSGPPN